MKLTETPNKHSDYSREKLLKVSSRLGSSLDLDETLAFLSKSLLELTGFDFCNIFMTDLKDSKYAVNKFGYFKGERVYLPKSHHIKEVFHHRKPIFYCGLENRKYLNPGLKDYLVKNNITCSMHIPITNKKVVPVREIKGCIILDKAGSACDLYASRITNDIVILVKQASVAIENCLMFQGIKNQRDRWYSLFDDSSDGIILVREDLNITMANTSSRQILGYPAKKLEGKNVLKLFSTEEAAVIKDDIENLFKTGRISDKHKRKREVILKGNGNEIWATIKLSLIKTTKDVSRVVITFEDISKIIELEQSKNEFISIISHELRSPLSIMKGFLSLLSKEEFGDLNDKQKNFVRRSYETNERMAELVEHILDVNRISMGRLKLDLEPVSIVQVFNSVKRDLEHKLEEKNIKLVIRKSKINKIMADKRRLYQILHNLLENAIKYSYPLKTIKARFTKEGNDVIFSITDKGVGISKQEQNKLFEKFFRINNVLSASAGGFGLGLFIVKKLVSAHGGQIWITSNKIKGTTFNIRFKTSNN